MAFLNLNSISNALLYLGLFFIFSIPSIKLLYSSQLINILALLFLVASILVKPRVNQLQLRFYISCAWLFFSTMLIFSCFYGYADFGIRTEEVINYVFLIISVFAIIFKASYSALRVVGLLIFMWGIFLSVWQLSIGIPTSREFGQHYLTVSMPLGAALAYSARCFFSIGESFYVRSIFYIGFGVIFLALTTLLSRSAFIFNGLIIGLFFFSYLLFNKEGSFFRKFVFFISSVVFSLVFSVWIYKNIEFRQLDRLMRLVENTGSESRMTDKYLPALHYISAEPLGGYGMGASVGLFGNYPHNIFLEILIIGGGALLLPFMFFVYLFFKAEFSIVRQHLTNSSLVGAGGFAMYFFLQFNSSFPLTNGYIPVGAMILLILGLSDYMKNEKIK